MDIRSLPTRFRLPLPKPVNGTFSSFKYNESPINNCAPTNPQPSQTSSLDVIPCQQTLNLHPIGKPMPNRRGRKPLATMPLGKKHIQNLTNQRAFRQRKEAYIRTLEVRANNLEMLYNSAQDEIKSLNDRITVLEKKLASSRSIRNEAIKDTNNRDPNTHYGGIVNSAMYQAIIDSHTNGPCDVLMSDQIPKDQDLFCDTSAERIWIASTSTASPLYSTFVTSNPSQNTRNNGPTFPPPQDDSQWIQPYFSQGSTTITSTAQHHPLNLKWILSEAPNEE